MKFTISYKFKLKMAQNLSGRLVPVPVPLVHPVPVPTGAADRPQEMLYVLEKAKNRLNIIKFLSHYNT